jgi:hypothetical protein
VALLSSLSTRQEVAAQLGVSWQQLSWILFKHGKVGYYRTWTIKKKRGVGTREIRAPEAALWKVQKALLPILQDAYKPRSAATHTSPAAACEPTRRRMLEAGSF